MQNRQKRFQRWSMAITACLFSLSISACSPNGPENAARAPVAIQVVDDDGLIVNLDKPAQRIITLSPHATELVYDIGAGKQVIATTRFSDYPKEALDLPTVGDVHQLDIEKIISLNPDLIVLWPSGSSAKQMAVLAATGIPIYRTNPRKLADIPASLRKLGQLTGHAGEAGEFTEQWNNQYDILRQRYHNRKSVTVFYQVFDQPIYTIGGKQVISEVIDFCGGRNIFSDIKVPSSVVDVETVLGRNPDVIISTGGGSGESGLGLWKQFPSLKAVQNHNLYVIKSDLISRPGPRIIQGIKYLCENMDKAR